MKRCAAVSGSNEDIQSDCSQAGVLGWGGVGVWVCFGVEVGVDVGVDVGTGVGESVGVSLIHVPCPTL